MTSPLPLTDLDQLSLFDGIPPPVPDAQRCKLCPRSAVWRRADGRYGPYCTHGACTNRLRLCQTPTCGRQFLINTDGAGTRYCSPECKVIGYGRVTHHPQCAWGCGKTQRLSYRSTSWPYICSVCIDPIKHLVTRLKDHHVPHEQARQLIANPLCAVGCGTNIVAKTAGGRGTFAALLVVDHDHTCCPSGSYSCGKCIRGLICRNCNAAAGLVRDDPLIAKMLGDYLQGGAVSL